MVSLTYFAAQANALELTAKSGSAAHIQAAVDEVKSANGGIVYIPEGDFETNGTIKIPAGVSIIGAGKNKTILRRIVPVFNADFYGSVGDGFSQLSNMSIINGNPVSEEVKSGAFEFRGCPTFRMDNCYIRGRFSTIMNTIRSSGLIDHCEFDVYTSYGIYIWGKNIWEQDINKILGRGKDTIFIEDCIFKGFFDHPIDGREAAHYVLRYCTFQLQPDSGPIEGHGPIPDGTHGTRCMEIYNNTIEVTGYAPSAGILYRSGGGVVFGNTIRNKRWGIAMAIENSPYNYPHIYPVYEQVHDLWIWNNTFEVTEDNIARVWNSEDMIQENRDYYLYEKSVYVPYTYPHPLTNGGAQMEQWITQEDTAFSDGVHNRPNPFRAGKEETLIEYDLEEPSNVIITIYDLLGQEVWQENYRSGGNGGKEANSVPWDGRNLSGKVVANGGYICRVWIEKEKRHMLRKIAVAK